MISKFFIDRPVLANVIALVIMLLGAVAIAVLPISQYPPITPPTVQVTANFPGATAETIVEKVALPIEEQVNGVEGMLYMQSNSTSTGRYTLTVTFAIGTDPNMAQVLVQNRVSAALAQLPQAVQNQGVVTKKKSTSILQIITLTSPTAEFDALFLSNFASIHLQDELQRVPGVGDIQIFGIGEYSIRIWLNPDLMKERSLNPSDVIQAIRNQNAEINAGQIGGPPAAEGQDFQYTIQAKGALNEIPDFEDIIVKSDADNGGQITRVRDIGRVELGARTYSQTFTFNGKPAGGIGIFQLPGSNALATADRVEQKMKELSKRFPEGVEYEMPFDTTVFVSESVAEVYLTLFEAGVLVLLVIVFFLQDWRAALVPATTVPVTIIGAFAAMAVLGFSVNTLTLFAIVLAIGIVVDDAIVVVEGAARHLERGLSPHDAAVAAMNQLIGPIIGITLVLMSVFLPAAFFPGITGQMYRQFALVIAATALISAINAVTLKPTQCALWLRKPDPKKRKNFLFRGFNAVYSRVEKAYAALIRRMVGRSGWMTTLGGVLIVLCLYGFTRIPTGFIPNEDQGYALVSVQLPEAATLERTRAVVEEVAAMIRSVPGVASTVSIGGVSAAQDNAPLPNSGVVYVIFEPWGERGKGEGLLGMYEAMSARLKGLLSASANVIVPPPIQGVGLSGGVQMQVELQDGSFNYSLLASAAERMANAANESEQILFVFTPFRAEAPQQFFSINRREAETYGVAVGDLFSTLETYVGSSYINQFTRFGRTFDIFAQADTPFRMTAEQIMNMSVRNRSGDMVPLGSMIEIQPDAGPSLVSLYNLYPTASVLGPVKLDGSSGQAMADMEADAEAILPAGVGYSWTGMSYQEQLVGNAAYLIFGLAVLLVYFVLAGQYESWILPLAVILAVPLALLGTVSVLTLLKIANNLYVQIGLVLLIALSAKNAILVVEMARENRARGEAILDAAVNAARNRFRPILMTSFTFILGVVPLILATGAGANARKSIGISVASGMLASTCLAVVFVPSFFVVLQRIEERLRKKKRPVASAAASSPGEADGQPDAT